MQGLSELPQLLLYFRPTKRLVHQLLLNVLEHREGADQWSQLDVAIVRVPRGSRIVGRVGVQQVAGVQRKGRTVHQAEVLVAERITEVVGLFVEEQQ